MNIKCAVFDFDGTLFDSMYVWKDVATDFLRSRGKEPKSSMREDVKTLSLYQSACYLKREYDLQLSVDEIIVSINRMIELYYKNDVMPKNGVVDFLEKLKSAGISMCIATATDRYLIESALKRCGIQHYFQAIFTCGEVGHGKDEPDIFRKVMEYFKADRDTTIIFEDALHAIKTAKNDGFKVVGVFDKSEIKQAEIRSIADCYINDFKYAEAFWNFIS